MFSDIDRNCEMLIGSYKKLKSYYHYNKNFIFMKEKIAEFEYDDEKMNQRIKQLAEFLYNPQNDANIKWIQELIEKIDFYVLPKAFVENENKNDQFVRSNLKEKRPINKVNFFINMPIELHLIDTLWTVLIGKIAMDHQTIQKSCYGNCLDYKVLYNHQTDWFESINFQKNKLFKIYFPQYCAWRNNAIETVRKENANQKSQILFSLDIKGFYYSVRWKFDILEKIFADDDRYKALYFETKVLENIFLTYTQLIMEYRNCSQNTGLGETVLPIGLFSSMFLANLYLSQFDKNICEREEVTYYGRYVDDIILIMDVSGEEKNINEKTVFERCLVDRLKILEKEGQDNYNLKDYSSLKIQKSKVKIFYFAKDDSKALIDQLEKTKEYPSQMNVIPEDELNLADFEEAIYSNNLINRETKLRDIGQLKIDRFKLGWHMSQAVMNNKVKRKYLTEEEKQKRTWESEKIIEFFVGNRAIEYSSNWINALYYFFLTENANQYKWKGFEKNIREAIEKIEVGIIEDIKKGKKRTIKAKLKRNLSSCLDISISVVMALHPYYSKKEKQQILVLARKIRQANLFNHNLVSFPLVNYSDDIDDNVDFTNITLKDMHSMNLSIRKSRKTKYSPRFVNLDEIFQYAFLIQSTHGGTYYRNGKKTIEQKIAFIQDFFYEINTINVGTAYPVGIKFVNEDKEGYLIQNIQLGEEKEYKEYVKIAIANIKMNKQRCCYGLPCGENIRLNRSNLIKFMKTAYADGKDKVDFIVFPEFYMPVQWVSDILSFVRKSGITVISGLQYITYKNRAFNNIAIFAPIVTRKYKNAIMLVREKNDYAPEEKLILSLEKFRCEDQKIPTYQIISSNGIRYGNFLCYEFTDIMARSLYKGKIDILFAPVNNKDTSYFSNIIETTARDLHIFIAQANTSVYGDSRITGPYGKNDRNVLQIKGGEQDDIVIGRINIGEVHRDEIKEQNELEAKIEQNINSKSSNYSKLKKVFAEDKRKVSKLSARFNL